MHLGDDRHPSIVVALEHVQLPERLGPVERVAHHLGRDRGDGLRCQRRERRNGEDMIVEVEVVVVDPAQRPPSPHRRRQLAPERRDQVQPGSDERAHPFDRRTRPHRRGVEDRRHADVQMRPRALEVEKSGVKAVERFHVSPDRQAPRDEYPDLRGATGNPDRAADRRAGPDRPRRAPCKHPKITARPPGRVDLQEKRLRLFLAGNR